MTIDTFLHDFEDELQLPAGSIRADMALRDVPRFDSMGRLSFMAMADAKYGVVIEADTLDRCPTVAALHAAVARQAK